MKETVTNSLAVCSLLLSPCVPALANDAVTPGDLIVEPATLHCLGFERPIEGDDNRNATVAVSYREAGTNAWREALSLLRIGGEKTGGIAGWPIVVTPHMFSGSVMDLEPGTSYEVRFVLSDLDAGAHSIRILRNRCANTQTCGISAQPTYGGPIYIIGNILYNVPRGVPFKFNVHPAGLVVYHNTVVAEWTNPVGWSNGHFRNNLFMGPVHTRTLTAYSTMDYNGYAHLPVKLEHPGRETHEYADLAAVHTALGWEQNGVQVTWDVFRGLEKPRGREKTYPTDAQDYSLKPGSAAVDRGCVLPNVNDGFQGEAPDLGALESGAKAPHYGPRNAFSPRSSPTSSKPAASAPSMISPWAIRVPPSCPPVVYQFFGRREDDGGTRWRETMKELSGCMIRARPGLGLVSESPQSSSAIFARYRPPADDRATRTGYENGTRGQATCSVPSINLRNTHETDLTPETCLPFVSAAAEKEGNRFHHAVLPTQ